MKIFIRNNENADKAIKRFKRSCSNAGIVKDVRRKAFYEKPTSIKRRTKLTRAKSIRKIQAYRLKS
jgi:small subunit ribosomal protein S21